MADTDSMSEMNAAAFEQEVRELHRFFERWYAGTVDGSAFSRMDVLDPSFVMIGPGGHVFPVDRVRGMVEAGYGNRTIDIEIRNVRIVPGTCVGIYEEWHTGSDGVTGRTSTAVMAPDAAMPNGLRWMHLHETWIPAERE